MTEASGSEAIILLAGKPIGKVERAGCDPRIAAAAPVIADVNARAEGVSAANIGNVRFQREDLEMGPRRHRLPESVVTGERHDWQRVRGSRLRVHIRWKTHGAWSIAERYRLQDVAFE